MEILTNRQKAFINEYLRILDPKKAAVNAGYSKDSAKVSATNLLKNPKIIKEMKNQLTKQADSLQVSKAYIVQRLLNIIEFSIAEEDILDKEGNKTGKSKLRDTQSSLRALDFLCKHLGMTSTEDILTQSEPQITFIKNLDNNKI